MFNGVIAGYTVIHTSFAHGILNAPYVAIARLAMSLATIATLILVLGAEFLNGWTDAPNATAAAVATGLVTRRTALWLAVILNAAGTLSALLFGAAVAHTIGKGIVSPDTINLATISAAMIAIIVWGSLAAYIGLPVSKSHALFAGLAGAAFQTGGIHTLLANGWITIGEGVLISTFLVFTVSWALAGLLLYTRAIHLSDKTWRRAQAAGVILIAYGHGWNDGLKFIGVFALVLLLGGVTSEFVIFPWIVVICALVMGAGTMCGGWRIVTRIAKEMVNDVYHPSQGMVSQLIAALSIGATAFYGIPMSTTHTIVSSVAGAKAAHGFTSVNWKIVRLIVQGWIATIVVCGLIAYCLSLYLRRFFKFDLA
jgi:PiT family inorganic phosphate transporter